MNTYARVSGDIKRIGSTKYINVFQIRTVQDPHEMYFHLLEVISARVMFDRKPVNGLNLFVVCLCHADAWFLGSA